MSELQQTKQGRVEILVGHRVSSTIPESDVGPDADYAVTPGQLKHFIESRADWTAFAAEELVNELNKAHPGPPRPMYALTFDDGYLDNLTNALPILETYGCAATIFITTGFIGRKTLPVEQALGAIIMRCEDLIGLDGRRFSCGTLKQKWGAYNSIRPKLKRLSPLKREKYISKISDVNHAYLSEIQKSFMTWRDVCDLDKHPLVTIGAHSMSHAFLPATFPIEAYREIRASKFELEERLGHPISSFAYPYGGHNRLVRYLARRTGFRFAFSTEPRCVNRLNRPDYYRIPRLDLKVAVS